MTTEATQQDLMDAARAAGFTVALTKQQTLRILDTSGTDWSPLTNADQRELLAEKCKMEVRFDYEDVGEGFVRVVHFDHDKGEVRWTDGVSWPQEAPSFPHAIVRAAAMWWRARNE